jgi:hypothetical protein
MSTALRQEEKTVKHRIAASSRCLLLAVFIARGSFANAQFNAAPGSPFTVGLSPRSIIAADFNGDGIPDLAVVNSGANNVTVLVGNGAGGFSAASGSPFPTGTNPVSLVAGDFNGDGTTDLAVANQSSNNVTVLLGSVASPPGTFGGFIAAPGSPFAAGLSPGPLAIGDFTGDGKPDLAVVGSSISILEGNGLGGFSAGTPFAVGTNPGSIAVGDFNKDGVLDLAVTTSGPNVGDNAVIILLGSGSGKFTAGKSYAIIFPFPSAVAVGDFNGDGIPDIVVGHSIQGGNGGSVTELLGDGAGGFSTGPESNVGTRPQFMAVADFNGDGKLDTAVVNSLIQGTVSVLLGDGSGGFGPSAVVASGSPVSLAVDDFNGDGTPDIATSSLTGNNVTVLLNSLPVISAEPASLTFYAAVGQTAPEPVLHVTLNSTAAPSTYTFASDQSWLAGNSSSVAETFDIVAISANPSSLSAGTYSGTLRYLAPNYFGAKTTVTLNVANPSATLAAVPGSPFAVGTNPVAAIAGDFNGDGKPDVAVLNKGSNNVTVLLGNGSGSFNAATGSPFSVGTYPTSMALGDFNRDGKPDLVVSNQDSNNITVLLGNGSGGFRAGPSFNVAAPPSPAQFSLAVGDFNGDGIADIVVSTSMPGGSAGVVVMLGNGFGGFTPATPFAAGAPTALAVGDFNQDGKLDVVFTNFMTNITDPPVTMLLGDGLGGFTSAQTLKVTGSAGVQEAFVAPLIAAGDFNEDGTLDIAVGLNNGVAVLGGNGSGGFSAGAVVAYGIPELKSFSIADFNGDGSLEIAASSSSIDISVSNLTTYVKTGPFPAGAGALLASADFNGDGRQDLAVVDGNGVTVLLGALVSLTSTLTTPSPLTVPYGTAVPLTLTVTGTTVPFDLFYGEAAFSDGATVLGTVGQYSPFSFTASGLAIGSHTLSATFTSSGFFNTRSSSNTVTIKVVPASQTLSFGPPSNVTLGIPPFTLSATATSGLAVSFASGTPAVCTVSGNTVTIVAAGSCSLTASQSGNANYLAAPSVTQSFTVTSAVAPGSTSDNFNEQTLNTSLWKFVNPAGDGSYSLNGTHLLLAVPGGSNHDPAFGGVDNTARVVQPVGNTDFAVQVRFDSIPDTQYQFQGIVVEQDAANFLRFQIGSTGSALVVNASTILGGIETVRRGGPVTVNGTPSSLWLRVRKSGDTWTQAWSQDGSHWQVVGSFKQALTLADIGPFAGNYNDVPSAAPVFTAAVNYFRNIPVPNP